MKRKQQKTGREAGFTLVELLVVLAILGFIMAIAAPQVMKYLGGAQEDAARIQVERLSGVVDLYRLDVGRYPTQDEGLNALVQRPSDVQGWNGPYLRNPTSLVDPWGNPYQYRFPAENGEFVIYSLGADGLEGDG